MYNSPTAPGNEGGIPTDPNQLDDPNKLEIVPRDPKTKDSPYFSTVALNYQSAGQTVPTDIATSGINNLVTNQLSQSTYDPDTKTWQSTDLPKNIKAAGNIYGVETIGEGPNKVSKLVTKDPNAKFAGNTFTNYNSYYFNNKDGTTTIVVPGKNNGKTETYKICDTKVYAQTLFLGASVLSFNASLAWGAESSRLTVELAVDSCKYPVFKDFNGDDVKRPTGNAALNDYNNKRFLKDGEGFQKNENGHSIIPGKVYYRPYNGVFQSDYWYDEDPGFYADIGTYSIDIIGMAARFCYDDFEFSGIITSWEKKSGESGVGLYTVTLESPSQLLKNVGVILDDYAGSVHQSVEDHSVYHPNQYAEDPNSRLGFPSMIGSNKKSYGGLIRNQSIPNLVNVYGFLEDGGYGSSTNFGGSLRNKNGIPAYMVVSALTYLLDRGGIYDSDGKQMQDNAWRIFRYSPYGRIVGPHPQYKNPPHATPTINFTDNNIKPNFFKMGLVLFPRQNLKFNNNDYTTLVPYSLDLNDFFFNYYSVLTPEYRFDAKTGDVLSLLQTAVEAHGYDMFVHMYMVPDGEYMYPRIKVNLVTKNITPQEGVVKQFIDYAVNNGINVTGGTVGEEFNGTEAVRTMLIGGKQKRLYQTKFIKYATQQNTLRWNPYTQTFLNTTFPATNTKDMRFADTTNPRNSSLGYGLPNAANKTNNIVDVLGRVDRYTPEHLHTKDAWGGFAYRMNYYEPVIIPGAVPGSTIPPNFPASSAGQICPYFGIDPFTNMARAVEYNDYYGQFFVSINGLEFAKLVNFSVPGFVQISENEIRAAIKGFDSFMGYINGLAKTLFPYASTHKFDLYNYVLRPLFGNVPNTLNAGAVLHSKFSNKTTGMDAVPVSATSNPLNDPILTNKLNRIHIFLQELGNQYYGKQFMVSIPRPMYYIDYNQHFSAVGKLPDGTLYSSLNGTKEIKTAFQPTDNAWEEAGTTIDDSIMVGTIGANVFTNDDGTINPILGYNSSFKFNDNRYQESSLGNQFFRNPAKNAFYYNWKKWEMARRTGTYTNADPINYYWEPSLIVAEAKYTFVDYPSVVPDPFPDAITGPRYPPDGYASKAYLAATVESDYVWAPASTLDGRALKMIVKTGGAYLSPNNLNDLSVTSAIADYVRVFWPMVPINGTGPYLASLAAQRLDNILSGSAYYLYYGHGYNSNNLAKSDTSNKPNQNLSIAPKAAMPGFAAIPFESNTDIYGPWISSPDMYRYSIFPYYDDSIPNHTEGRQNKIENLIGGTKAINEPDLVPWNFGGMINLDMHALLRVNSDNSYQQKGETGQLTYFGTPFFNLASELKATSNLLRGPIINNVQTQITSTGPITTYTFRTYTKKFALFNKENADRLRSQAQESFKRTREIRARFESLKADLYALSRTQMIFPNYDLTLSKLRSSSPFNILVGSSKPYVSPAAFHNRGTLGPTKDNYNLYWTTESSLQRSNVSLYNIGEVSQEFEEDFASKAFMSLDGLFSPVSFYPTIYGGTAAYKPFFQAGCPNCLGTKQVWDDTLPAENGNGTGRWILCSLCTTEIAGTEQCTKYDTLPPFVLSNASDGDMYYGGNGDSPLAIVDRIKQLLDTNTSRQRINYVNLNPIIMPVGEFRNEYAQTGDYTSHNIEYIGRSQVPPRGDLSIPNNKVMLGFDEDQSILADADNNSKVFDDLKMRELYPDDPPNLPWTQKNYRFLGLRGPLVLSGWGFDTAGFPVPNSSGEPKGYGPDGNPLRIRNVYDQNPSSTTIGPILGKNQVQIQDAQGTPRWSDPYRETTFLKSWGLQSHLWPTGPVDLRWDESRRVWAAPKPYPNVYVELEHDLVAPYPSRGFLNAIDKATPLPNGLRRTVFVRDSSESFGAPRGAKILCFYDEGSGFYEPLSRTPIVAFGVVVSSNSNNGPGYNNAIITAEYAAGFNPTTGEPLQAATISVNFSNPLGFTLISGLKGLFMFVKTQWVLMSVNSCQGG